MKKIRLGNTGMDVSEICLGAMHLGSRKDQALSFKLMDMYADAGGSFLDTANIYAHWFPGCQGGESETVVGSWLRSRKSRSDFFIASKVGLPYPGVKYGLKTVQIIEECEKSLKRLGTDVIDLYYFHNDDRDTPLEESLEAMSRLVSQGKVRHIGASNFVAWRLNEALSISKNNRLPEFCCLQSRYTYLLLKPGADISPQQVINDEIKDLCRAKNITLLAYSPLLKGAYARQSIPPLYEGANSTARMEAISQMAAQKGATVNQIVLAWLLQGEPAIIPVMAVGSAEQMNENLGSLQIVLSKEELASLDSI